MLDQHRRALLATPAMCLSAHRGRGYRSNDTYVSAFTVPDCILINLPSIHLTMYNVNCSKPFLPLTFASSNVSAPVCSYCVLNMVVSSVPRTHMHAGAHMCPRVGYPLTLPLRAPVVTVAWVRWIGLVAVFLRCCWFRRGPRLAAFTIVTRQRVSTPHRHSPSATQCRPLLRLVH